MPENPRVRRVDPVAPTTKGERTTEPAFGAEARNRCDNSADTERRLAAYGYPIASSQAGHNEPDQPDASTGLSEGRTRPFRPNVRGTEGIPFASAEGHPPLAESDRCWCGKGKCSHCREYHECSECGGRLVPYHDLWECLPCGVVL